MAKKIHTYQELQKEMLTGISALADTVRSSLGPAGRNTVLHRPPAPPFFSSEGASIAEEISLENRTADMGIRVIREAASRTRALAGDGSATAIILAHFLLQEGYRNIAAGANPMELRKGIQGAAQLAAASIQRLSRPVKTREAIEQIAASASSDPHIAALIADALEQVGPDGMITVEESGTLDTVLSVEPGMQFQRGYLAPEMITDPNTRSVEFSHPYLLITDEKITSARRLLPLLEQIAGQSRPLLIIADGLEQEARALVLTNIQRGILRAAAVNAPAYGDGRRARLEDLAIFTGGTFVSEENGISLPNVTLSMLGSADSVRITQNTTSISGGKGDLEAIRIRRAILKKRIQETSYDFEREQARERLSKLSGGAAVIRIGAPSASEAAEQKLLAESALRAVRAAAKEGIVPGGGVVYLCVQPAVQAYLSTLQGDRKTGAGLLLRALEQPLLQLAENAGQRGAAVLGKIRCLPPGTGYDVQTGRYVPMLKAGIADPAMVSRIALQSAVSASTILLTAGAGASEILSQ